MRSTPSFRSLLARPLRARATRTRAFTTVAAAAAALALLGACERHVRRQLRDRAGRRFEFTRDARTRLDCSRRALPIADSDLSTTRAVAPTATAPEPLGSARFCFTTPEFDGSQPVRPISICDRAGRSGAAANAPGAPACALLECSSSDECPDLLHEHGTCQQTTGRCTVLNQVLRCN